MQEETKEAEGDKGGDEKEDQTEEEGDEEEEEEEEQEAALRMKSAGRHKHYRRWKTYVIIFT